MRRLVSYISAVTVIMAAMVPSLATATAPYPKGKGNIENGKKIFTEGKGEVPACNSCHGEKGLGDDNMGTPRIAGQFYTFLRKQLEDFATDKRTDKTMGVMNNNAKGLTPQDRDDVATYLASLRHHILKVEPYKGSNLAELKASGIIPVGESYKGKSLVEWGQGVGVRPEGKEVPACKACHGYNGVGSALMHPQINQQTYVYLVNQLKYWRDGSRANDPLGQMRAVARNMTDEDIYNAAAYLTNASSYSPGNSTSPYEY